MAGAGYKLFNTGDVLLASEVNTYLQQQTVMVFASSAARTTALSGVLAEGMMSYLQDTNSVEVYNGSSWVNVGNAGDITGVTAGTGISGGGSSGDVTITNSMATAIDAKGDLIVGTGADTFSRLAVGTNDYVLTAASGEATGLKWAAPSVNANWSLVNTGGTSLTGATTITISSITGADKVMVLVSGASASGDAFIGVRINADTGSNYQQYGITHIWASSYNTNNYTNLSQTDTMFNLARLGASGSAVASGYCLISGGNSSGSKIVNGLGIGTLEGQSRLFGGVYTGSSTISSISLFSSSGNFDAGTIWVYTSA